MDLEKLPVQLALQMGRKLQSMQTGFIHLFSEDLEAPRDTILLSYNFLFALALIRSRITEQALEGIELIKKMLPFQREGLFPKFLHEFPHGKPCPLIKAVVNDLLEHYQPILGASLIAELKKLDLTTLPTQTPDTLTTWGTQVLFHGVDEEACQHYNPELGIFLGQAAMLPQDGALPKVHLFNLILGIYHGEVFESCLTPAPWHLLAALIRTTPQKIEPRQAHVIMEENPTPSTAFRILWQEEGAITSIEGVGPGLCQDMIWTIPLTGEVEEERKERIEASIYISLSPTALYTVDGGKSNLFWSGEEFAFFTPNHKFTLSFSLIEGHGKFSAHVQLGNRPNQSKSTQGVAYDLRIGLRTIERSQNAKLQVKLGLSTATPIACIPLST